MKYLIDFTALAFLYAFVFLKKWKSGGRDVLLVNTLMYIYLSFVLYFTLMPIIVELPFILNHPYTPMNPGCRPKTLGGISLSLTEF